MPSTGAVGVVADRVGALLGRGRQLGRVGHELARDRIVRSAGSISSAIAGVIATA